MRTQRKYILWWPSNFYSFCFRFVWTSICMMMHHLMFAAVRWFVWFIQRAAWVFVINLTSNVFDTQILWYCSIVLCCIWPISESSLFLCGKKLLISHYWMFFSFYNLCQFTVCFTLFMVNWSACKASLGKCICIASAWRHIYWDNAWCKCHYQKA